MKRKTDNFNKFYNKKRNSAIKEEFRQEKKAAKKERKEAIERRFEEKRQARAMQSPAGPVAGKRGPFTGKGDPAAGKTGPAAGRFDKKKPALTLRNAPSAPPVKGSTAPPVKGPAAATSGKPGILPANAKGPTPNAAPGKPGITQVPGKPASGSPAGETLPLNKYIAHGGICSRRDAADLIRAGKVSVNGQIITEPGTKVLPTDTVKVQGKKVTISRNFVYILLNKPKDYITTTEDPQGRKTVLDLIRHATTERVFPVGRLDRNTSGVLLLTNDGDLSQKLAHPSHEIKKIYHVSLDKALTKSDFDKIIGGEVHLEDGAAHVDVMAYADPKDKTQIGLEIHSGRNRIVRRIFEHLGYDVRGLDRVMYAGLTKKNVQRGKWRLLTEKEIRILKYLNSSIKGSPARAKEWAAAGAAGLAPVGKGSGAAAAKGSGAAAGAAKLTPFEKAVSAPGKAAPAKATPYKTDAAPATASAPVAKGPASKPGKRPARSIPPKGRKPASATQPKSRRPYKSTNFNNEED